MMNCENFLCDPCDPCEQNNLNRMQYPYTCCGAGVHRIPPQEPLIAVRTGHRCTKKPARKAGSNCNKNSIVKKKKLQKPERSPEICKISETKKQTSLDHPNDCCCTECQDKNEKGLGDNCEEDSRSKSSAKISSVKENCSSNSMAERSLKNYLYDNSEMKESNCKKGFTDLDDLISCDTEVWLLQIPKNFDPKELIGNKLGGCPKVEASADRFSDKKTLAIIAPEKAAEYELICDSIKLITPVGKIIVSENTANIASEKENMKSASACSTKVVTSSGCESDGVEKTDDNFSSDEEETKPLTGKKIKKKMNDQRFTIETTVTVENVGNRKKGKKSSCLPIVPTEPSPMKKKKKSGC